MECESISSAAVPVPSDRNASERLPAVLFMAPELVVRVYDEGNLAALREHLMLPETCVSRENWRDHLDLLRTARVVVSSWGGPPLEGVPVAEFALAQILFSISPIA